MGKFDFLKANLQYLARDGFRLPGGHRPPDGHDVPEDVAGLCVATAPDPACDDYVLRYLREVGIRHVRVDYTFGCDGRHTARLVNALLEEGIRVLLHAVQPYDEALKMSHRDAQDRWRSFLVTVLDRWGASLEALEVGSTVNRRKWAGYTLDTFMAAWQIAYEEARQRSVRLAGPNVTDFEPFYNVALLARMRADNLLPDIHTDNLFAERATEPENYDHKILGSLCAPLIKYNVIKKARLLQRIADTFGVADTWSTHVAWSKRRIDRILPNVEEKQADYLARYFLLAAASGALKRVYWGPMIGQREGIIDDGTDEYPEPIPHVTLYNRARGDVARYRVRPALHALKTFAALIPGTRYLGRLNRSFGLEVHAFAGREQLIHAVWTVNGRGADWSALYQAQDLEDAEWIGRDGNRLEQRPALATESPSYLTWSLERKIQVQPAAQPLPQLCVYEPVHPYQAAGWRGVVAASSDEERACLLEAIAPHGLDATERREVLRDARNAVWLVTDPRDPKESIVVKRAQVTKQHKKVLDRLKPSKARRSWNGASELLRRGIETPRPIAFFEQANNTVLAENFYLCAFEHGNLSVRRFFTVYAKGADRYEDIAAPDFYRMLSAFLLNMHQRGVYFRDLSAGNVLVVKEANGSLRFSLIDTARARFFNRPATLGQRLSDLKRICHPLDWAGRHAFVGLYLEELNQSFSPLRQIPFRLYDLKHRVKNWMKGR